MHAHDSQKVSPAPGDPVWIHHNNRTFGGRVKAYGPQPYEVTVTTDAGDELVVHQYNVDKDASAV